MDCSPSRSSAHGILQARILEQVAMLSSRGSSQPRDRIHFSYISCIEGGFFTTSTTWKAPIKTFCCSLMQSCLTLVTPWTSAHQASLSVTISPSLLKLMSIELVVPSSHLILCRPLLLLPSVFPSITVFSNESALHIRWPKDWSFSFSISPSNEYSGLITFRIDWCDLLAVQETLKSLLQRHSSEVPLLWCSASFWVVVCGDWKTVSGKLGTCRAVCVGKDVCFHSELKSHGPHLSFLNIIEFCIHEHRNPNLGSQPWEDSSWNKNVLGLLYFNYLLWYLDHQKSKRVPEKHLFLLYWLCQSLWLCGSQETVEHSERDGNTRPPNLPFEKSVCRSGSNS